MIVSKLHAISSKKAKRLGRGLGSGKGAKSGRGTTRHQKARENIPLHFEGGMNRFTKKFPLLRGKGRNKPVSQKPLIVHLDALNAFDDNNEVTKETLVEKNIIQKQDQKKHIKILLKGTLEKKLTVHIPVSKNVQTEIEKKGGTIEI